MLTIIKKKSTYQKDWYTKNKERIAKKRKQLYAENPEYREQRIEASRRYRRGERISLTIPADAPISLAQAAKSIGRASSTLREWRRKNLFPEPKYYQGRVWFTEKQVELLKPLKKFVRQYKMMGKIKHSQLAELRAFIFANWK